MAALATPIVQVRMGSSRLPGKALLPLWRGQGALELLLSRASRAALCAPPVVATTDRPEDDEIERLCGRLGVPCFRGHATDVLDRYYRCAQRHAPRGPIVRLTGDCPLHDPAVIDRVVARFNEGGSDYASNTHPPTYPDGLDVEVLSFSALEAAWHGAKRPVEREHVSYYVYTRPTEFRLANVRRARDLSALRWTLDEPRDLEFIRAAWAAIGREHFGMDELLATLERRPELSAINGGIGRDEGLRCSLATESRGAA